MLPMLRASKAREMIQTSYFSEIKKSNYPLEKSESIFLKHHKYLKSVFTVKNIPSYTQNSNENDTGFYLCATITLNYTRQSIVFYIATTNRKVKNTCILKMHRAKIYIIQRHVFIFAWTETLTGKWNIRLSHLSV